jgi:cellulose biosynthesis protein BcsQ
MSNMKVISFFNNKGGVGKTTLTANMAGFFAKKLGCKVLVIDCDPQCNVTQLILGDIKVIGLYWVEEKEIHSSFNYRNILDIVQPIIDGDAEVEKNVEPIPKIENRYQVDIIAGHPQLSSMEDPLSRAWGEIPAGKIGGFRVSNWLRSYIHSVSGKYDYAFVDLGPSLGSINRSVLLASDYFVTPLGADIFSIMGLRNIAKWMSDWTAYYKVGLEQSERLNKGALERFDIPKNVNIDHGYIGYTLQQYITKSKKGQRRPTDAFEKILRNVPAEVDRSLLPFFGKNVSSNNVHLGDVPNLYSLIPMAQKANSPIFDLRSGDGLVGSQFKQTADREGADNLADF